MANERGGFSISSLLAKKEVGIFVLLVVLCTIVALRSPAFLSTANLQNTARLIGIYGIFSIGLGIVIITGGIELSVGSVFALQGVMLAIILREWHWHWALAVLAVIGGSMLLGCAHGFFIAAVRMQAFIVTLCGLLFYRGMARYIARDETKGFGVEDFGPLRHLATGNVGGSDGVPTPFVLLIVIAAIMWVVLHRSVYGRYLFAVGRNEDAAKYSGINSRLVIGSAYVVCMALTGVAGIIIAFYTNSISPAGHGNFYELYGIAAAVLGGCSLSGGEGSIIGIVIGTALLQVLQNLVNLLGIDPALNFSVMGGVIFVGVLADKLLSRRKGAAKGGAKAA
jgi:ribose transport system permease protein